MSWDKAVELLKAGESEQLEFIPHLKNWDEIAAEMCAFANGDGGQIVIGLDDKNKYITGVDVNKDTILTIARDRCTPKIFPQIEVVTRAGKNVVIVIVPEGNVKPYTTRGTIYIRDGKYTRPAKKDEENTLKGPWQTAGLNTREKKALHYVSDQGSISNREYRSLLGVSHKTAHLELTHLVKKKILSVKGSGRSTRYIFPR